MKHGSLYSGIGGTDTAVEWATGARTVWQLDMVNESVRSRHWPGVTQIVADISTVDPSLLEPVDIISASFACQDLSCAGQGASREDLDAGTRTGPTYQGLLGFVRAIQPEIVVIENVPGLLAHQWRVERDLIGYGLTWVRCGAWDAGAPHIRRRIFVVGIRGSIGRGVVDAPTTGRWSPVESERVWATPTTMNPNETEPPESWEARRRVAAEKHGTNGIGEPLGQQVRTWSTPINSDDKAPGDHIGPRGAPGLGAEVRTWSTPKSSDARSPGPSEGRGGTDGIACEVRTWPTVVQRDYKCGELPSRVGAESLSQAASNGKRLSPDWTETLMGLPVGWTLPTGPRLEVELSPRWPHGRYPKDWDRSIPWPGFDWEPARTLPDGPPCLGRPARIRALGNCVLPQQGLLALKTVL